MPIGREYKMSKIDEMLKNEKVDWKRLGEVCEIKTGKLNVNAKVHNGKYLFFTTAQEISYINEYAFEGKSLLVAGNANIGDVKYYIGKFNAYQRVYVLQNFNNIYALYLMHFMKMELKNYLQSKKKQAAMTYIVLKDLEDFKITIPSLQTQEKIVKILDEFTNCVTKLQAELKARIKQYSYHRDMLLSEKYLNKISEKIDGLENKGYKIRFTTLGEIGEIQMCKRILKEQTLSQGDIPFYKIGTFGKKADSFISKELFREYREKYNYPKKGEILISASGTIGKTVIFDGKDAYFQDSNIVWISHNEEIALNKYLYYFYQVINWNPSTGGTINRLYNYNLKNVKAVLPPLELQNKVVEILDKFQSLIADTKGLLPKEIEERKKQYEYYREKLLTFDIKLDNNQSINQ